MFTALAAHPWAYPLLEVMHLLGVALVLGNLLVLPYSILPIAIPLSILEAAVAACIIKTWKKRTEPQF